MLTRLANGMNVPGVTLVCQLTASCWLVGSLTQAVRNFAKSLEAWLKGALVGVPDEMVKTKVSLRVHHPVFQ